MEDLVAAAIVSIRPIALRLPVEGSLHGVFHREGAAGNEEEMGKGIGDGDLPERLDERRELPRVHVAVGGIAERRSHQRSEKRLVLHLRMVVADWQRREVPIAVEVLLALQGIHYDGTVRLLEIDDDVKAVDQDIALQRRKDGFSGNGDRTHRRLLCDRFNEKGRRGTAEPGRRDPKGVRAVRPSDGMGWAEQRCRGECLGEGVGSASFQRAWPYRDHGNEGSH
jgi:hypothetical protein